MFEKKLCSSCKTGKASFEIDNHSEGCPYLSCYTENKCGFYEPLEIKKKTLWNKIRDLFSRRK